MTFALSLAKALSLTIGLELLFSLIWGHRKETLAVIILMNLLTNPAVNALYHFMTVFLGWQMLLPTVILELIVIVAEGACCKDFMEKPWLFAISCNAFSYLSGLCLQKII